VFKNNNFTLKVGSNIISFPHVKVVGQGDIDSYHGKHWWPFTKTVGLGRIKTLHFHPTEHLQKSCV